MAHLWTSGAIICIFFFTVFGNSLNAQSKSQREVRILPESSLVIEGKSNVNTFRYRFTGMPNNPAGTIIGSPESLLKRLTTESLGLDVRSFDAGQKRMNRDFWKLLEADKHPEILISVEALTALNSSGEPIAITSKQVTDIWVHANFTIAGTTLLHAFPVNVTHENGQTNLEGELEVNIEDFGLEAPTAVLGLIRVHNRITIIFDLTLDYALPDLAAN